MNLDDLLSIPEAAARYRRQPSTIRSAIERGRLPAKRVGRVYVLLAQDVADYIGSSTGRGRPPAWAKRPRRGPAKHGGE